MISSLILNMLIETPEFADEIDRTCGSGFPKNWTALSERVKKNLERPTQLAYSSVVTIDLVCMIVALMIVGLFLNALKRDELKRHVVYIPVNIL